ncbi:ubiquitin-ubiquitin ligase HUL5 [Sporobolomyces koalae]|uniref:ubiquitin-ubiquitin ligase HUL5 n=1 Tax=Sporobolomyces koalae TaxID=500713 RepID=UPI00316FA509
MQHLFTGSATRRPTVNLGGVRSTPQASHQDLVLRARLEREAREADRQRTRAAGKIQAFYRGRKSARSCRQALREQYDRVLSPSSTAPTPEPSSLVHASRLLALFFTDGNKADVKRLATWCRAALQPCSAPSTSPAVLLAELPNPHHVAISVKTPRLFALYDDDSWAILVRQIGSILFLQATSRPSLPQSALFLEVAKILSDEANYGKYKVARVNGPKLLPYLLDRRMCYEHLGKLIRSIPITNRSHPLLPAAVSMSLLPFKVFAAPLPPASKGAVTTPSPARLSVLVSFATHILSIPLLANRFAPKETAALGKSLPIFDIVTALSDPSAAPVLDKLDVEQTAHLLANLVSFGSSRITTIDRGNTLAAWLQVTNRLMDKLPIDAFKEDKGKGKAIETIVLDDSEDEADDVEVLDRDESGDVLMSDEETLPSSTSRLPVLDSRTRALLLSLSSRPYTLNLLALSTRYPTSSRLPLTSYLCSLLAILPAASKDSLLNTLLYAPAASGLLRELYRTFLRTGALGKLLSQARREKSTVIMAALSDNQYQHEWPVVTLVLEMYSRCLLTMGDDEFYAESAPGGIASARGGRGSEARNPLSLDEVVGLSAMARNTAFAMYWQEGTVVETGDETKRKIVGLRSGYDEVRTLMTRFLQQVHARDSRRQFTPEDHWHMTSQFDLASFVQTAIFEDERLQAEGQVPSTNAVAAPTPTRNREGEDDDEDDEFVRNSTWRRTGLARPAPGSRQKVLSKRQLALISPRLGVLNNIPFVIPFETRVAIFRQFIDTDFRKLTSDAGSFMPRARHRAVVRRNHLAEDAYTHLNGLGSDLKKRIEIVFIDEHGLEESGIDGGGLFKELLTSLSKEVFDTDRGLWLATKEQEIYPNPHNYAKESSQLSWFTFLGRIVGKALYQGILIDVRFAAFFLAKWLGKQSYLDDLASLDPELYAGLLKLKNYPGNVEDDLSLNFTVTDEDFGVSRTVDLIPNGSEIPVTNENRMQYIVLMSNYRLNVQIAQQSKAFERGMFEIIPERFLRLFNAPEMAILVGGVDAPIDVTDLRRHTIYGGWDGDENNPTIRDFWTVFESFGKDDRAKLVKFVTSCARPPLLGFGELNPLFAIRNAGQDESRLPTSATCVNLLKLPEYKNIESLRAKLLYAINSGAGFDLS